MSNNLPVGTCSVGMLASWADMMMLLCMSSSGPVISLAQSGAMGSGTAGHC